MRLFKKQARRRRADMIRDRWSAGRLVALPGACSRGGFLFTAALFLSTAVATASETTPDRPLIDWEQRNPLLLIESTPSPAQPQDSFFVELAQQAAEVGLHRLAENLFRRAMEDGNLAPGLLDEVRTGLASTLVAGFRPHEALEVLDRVEEPGRRQTLIRIIAHLQADQSERAQALLAELDQTDPDPPDSVWLALAEAYLLSRSGETMDALEAFSNAWMATPLPHLRRQIELASLIESLRVEEASDAQAVRLRRQMEDATRPEVRLRLLREYALTLDALDRRNDAVEAIISEMPGWTADVPSLREELLFIVGLLTRGETDEGRSALRELLRSGSDRELLSAGLGLLISASGDARVSELSQFLSNLLQEYPAHPLADEVLFVLARLGVAEGELDQAVERLDALAERFPGSDIIPISLRLRAYLAWRQSPPRLRIAATHLLDSIQPEDDPDTQRRVLALAGDLYLLNRDYSNAASLYEQARALSPVDQSSLFFRKVHALILNHQGTRAQHVIDNAGSWLQKQPDLRWMLEWSLLSHLRTTGRIEAARTRALTLLSEAEAGATPASRALYFRIRWIDASLTADIGSLNDALAKLERLMQEVGIDANLTPAERDLLWSQSALLKGQILLRDDREAEASEMFERLRRRLPETRAAVLSILLEARHFAARDLTIEAQQRLVSLADDFPESEYAVQALFEAAEVALSRGTESSIDNALRFLDLISQRYPDDPARVQARVRQAEILTERQQSGAARSIYENLLRGFPDHPLRPIIEMRLADANTTNPNATADQLGSALAIYRRIGESTRAPTGVRAEASYKTANLLNRMGHPEEAIAHLWKLVELARGEPIRNESRYWIARALFDLGQWLENHDAARDARALYQMVIDFRLPGTALAQARLRRIDSPTENSTSP